MTIDKNAQQQYYENNAEGYDDRENLGINRRNRNHFKKLNIIMDELELRGDERVLELGCGTGIHAEKLLSQHPTLDYLGIDISDSMLERARSVAPSGDFETGDAQALDCDDDEFNAVIGTAFLHHLEDQPGALEEFVRVTKPNGKIVLMEPNYLFPKDFVSTHVEPQERHKRHMLRWHLESVLDDLPGHGSVENRIYTPPWPKALHDQFDAIDDVARKIPLVKDVSMMLKITIRL